MPVLPFQVSNLIMIVHSIYTESITIQNNSLKRRSRFKALWNISRELNECRGYCDLLVQSFVPSCHVFLYLLFMKFLFCFLKELKNVTWYWSNVMRICEWEHLPVCLAQMYLVLFCSFFKWTINYLLHIMPELSLLIFTEHLTEFKKEKRKWSAHLRSRSYNTEINMFYTVAPVWWSANTS